MDNLTLQMTKDWRCLRMSLLNKIAGCKPGEHHLATCINIGTYIVSFSKYMYLKRRHKQSKEGKEVKESAL